MFHNKHTMQHSYQRSIAAQFVCHQHGLTGPPPYVRLKHHSLQAPRYDHRAFDRNISRIAATYTNSFGIGEVSLKSRGTPSWSTCSSSSIGGTPSYKQSRQGCHIRMQLQYQPAVFECNSGQWHTVRVNLPASWNSDVVIYPHTPRIIISLPGLTLISRISCSITLKISSSKTPRWLVRNI